MPSAREWCWDREQSGDTSIVAKYTTSNDSADDDELNRRSHQRNIVKKSVCTYKYLKSMEFLPKSWGISAWVHAWNEPLPRWNPPLP